MNFYLDLWYKKHVFRGKLEVKVFLINNPTPPNKILIDENFSKYLDFNNEILKKSEHITIIGF